MSKKCLSEAYAATNKETVDAVKFIHKRFLEERSVQTDKLFTLYKFVAFHQDEEAVLSGKEELEIAFMQPETGCIFLNLDSPSTLWTTIIAHEIGHFFLDHAFRAVRKMAEILGLSPHNLTPKQIADINSAIYSDEFSIANIAGDAEIAHEIYDEDQEDKIKKYMKMYGKACSLIINETFPQYEGLTFEEMLEDLYNKYYNNSSVPEFEVIEGKLQDDITFVGNDGTVYDKAQLGIQ